jgi:putative aldouronate transport system substrate-binding protein
MNLEEIENNSINCYKRNMNYFESQDKELFERLRLFEIAIEEDHYATKYQLEYRDDSYFDIFDSIKNEYIYDYNSNDFSKNLANNVNFDITINSFKTFYDTTYSIREAWGPVVDTGSGMLLFEKSPNSEQGFDDYRYQEAPIWGPTAIFQDYYNNIVEMPEMMTEKANIMETYYEPYMTNSSLPSMKFTNEEIEWLSTTGNDINNTISDYQAKWLLIGGIDEEWEKFNEELNKMGLDKHIELMKTVYDRYTSK